MKKSKHHWMNKVAPENIEVIHLRSGWFARPAGALGTCGFYPVPWGITKVTTKQASKYKKWEG